ncbi:hypothetical protein KAR52_00765 [Candidatus Pacearchaeota archaeon]|nr:hypothetical protein [Candidatus Pacearchaeota archaeon]
MRKITSPRNKRKKDKIKQLAVGGVLIFIMFFSVLGYAFGGGENEDVEKINYNGLEFVNQNGFWFLELGGLDFAFKNNPHEVEKIYSSLNYANNYQSRPLYISSESNEAELEIYRNLNQLVQRIQPACLNKYECVGNWPVKNCTDNFIIIKEDDISKITQEDNCVFISGPQENLTALADEFLFKILGIEQ